MENSQSQNLFDISNMSDLELDIYSDAVFSVLNSLCNDEYYLISLSFEIINELLSNVNKSIEFFLDIERLDYVEDMLKNKLKLEKVIKNIQK